MKQAFLKLSYSGIHTGEPGETVYSDLIGLYKNKLSAVQMTPERTWLWCTKHVKSN